jgi:hypothetical protein
LAAWFLEAGNPNHSKAIALQPSAPFHLDTGGPKIVFVYLQTSEGKFEASQQ